MDAYGNKSPYFPSILLFVAVVIFVRNDHFSLLVPNLISFIWAVGGAETRLQISQLQDPSTRK